MKTQTKALDLQKLLALIEAENKATGHRQHAQRVLDNLIRGSSLPLIDPVILSQARRAREEEDAARETFNRLPKPRRDTARAVHNAALEIGHSAARQGDSYSGETSYSAGFGNTATAYTSTTAGDRYSRRCKYMRTDAEHVVTLDPARVHNLVEMPHIVRLSEQEGLPLIALDDDGRAVWVKTSGKRVVEEEGWVVGDHDCIYHSTKSREDANRGHARKRAELDRRKQEEKASARETRRAFLVARLCHGLKATIADAKACGYCDPGIAEFQRRHNIGDTAALPELVKSGNPLAVSLALKLARQARKQAA